MKKKEKKEENFLNFFHPSEEKRKRFLPCSFLIERAENAGYRLCGLEELKRLFRERMISKKKDDLDLKKYILIFSKKYSKKHSKKYPAEIQFVAWREKRICEFNKNKTKLITKHSFSWRFFTVKEDHMFGPNTLLVVSKK